MRITLNKKNDSNDKDPLLVQFMSGPNRDKKVTMKVAIGQSLDLEDDEAYEVLGKYRGLFSMAQENSSKSSYSHKAQRSAE